VAGHTPSRADTVAGSPDAGVRARRAAAALLPLGKHIVFEESSHALQLKEQDKFQGALAAFVTGGSAELSGHGEGHTQRSLAEGRNREDIVAVLNKYIAAAS
jgi:hypothetical protein